MMTQRTPTERFWAKVDKTDTCWLWTAAVDGCGYGGFRVEGRLVKPHRWSYEALVGPIPDGLELDHLCRVRHCVNPAHLEPVTHAENVRRGSSPIARQAAQTHCVNGHEFSDSNTYVRQLPSGRTRRVCRACDLDAGARWRERRRGAAS